MTLLRCASCRASFELAFSVIEPRCGACSGVLLPATSGVVQVVVDDEPTRPLRKRSPMRGGTWCERLDGDR
jgi:hypothetical protein